MKPLLVGEDNPYSDDPDMALYPFPERSAGYNLAVVVMMLFRKTYLTEFDRKNLCVSKWSVKEARKTAWDIAAEERPVIVLCGAKVARVFDLAPATAAKPVTVYPVDDRRCAVVIPHPSGRNRIWNADGAYAEVRRTLAGVLPDIPFGELI